MPKKYNNCRAGWIDSISSSSKIWSSCLSSGSTVEHSGAVDQKNRAHGESVVTWYLNGVLEGRYTGKYSNGKKHDPNGTFEHYRNGEYIGKFVGEYKAGKTIKGKYYAINGMVVTEKDYKIVSRIYDEKYDLLKKKKD